MGSRCTRCWSPVSWFTLVAREEEGPQEDRRTGGEGKDGEEREVARSREKGVASEGVITAQDNTW